MPYGTIKFDTVTFTNGGVDQSVTISGIIASTSGNLTVTGVISGGTVNAYYGNFTSLTGTTVSGTNANFQTISGISGVFTTRISGAVITGNTAGFTTVTGTTVTGTTANFVTLSGTTITGITVNTTTGIFPSGSATAPSIQVGTGTTYAPGIYSPGTDQLAISTNGSGRLFVDSSGNVKLGSSAASGFRLAVDGDVWLGNQAGTEIGRIINDAGVLHLRASSNVTGLALGTNGVERLRITSAGNVGVGTSSPSAKLHVSGADIKIDGTTTATLNLNGSTYGMVSAAADLYVETAGAGNQVIFRRGGTESARFDASGRLGVGTTTPGSFTPGNLVVEGATTAGITISDSTGGGTASIAFSATPSFQNRAKINCTMSSQSLEFSTATVERMRIDSSGRLLVGTSSARSIFLNGTDTAAVQVEGTSTDTASLAIIRNSNTTGYPLLHFAKTRGTTVGSTTVVQSGDVCGGIEFEGSDGTEFVQAASIRAEVDGTPGANDMPGRLVFSVTADGASSPTERMRITNGGYLKASNNGTYFDSSAATHEIYSTGNTSTLRVYNASTSYTSISVPITVNTAASTGWSFLRCYHSTDFCFNILGNGNVVNTNNSYGAISDVKLKENIVDANSQWNDLKALQVRNYNFKEGQTHTQIGLVAQEVELVSPGLVTESPDRDEDGNDLGTVTKSVNYSVLYMKAVKALQEAMERIETLEAKVAALEGV